MPAKQSVETRVEFPWLLDELEGFPYVLRRMFGCTAVYEGDRLLLIFRSKDTEPTDNGVWIAVKHEHQESLAREFPQWRPVGVIGGAAAEWRMLPEDASDFESAARRVCELVLARDPRVGKVPKSRSKKPDVAPPGKRVVSKTPKKTAKTKRSTPTTKRQPKTKKAR